MNELLWVRVGDDGAYESFTDIQAAVDYMNALSAGLVGNWIDAEAGVGFSTSNCHGNDFVSCFWGDADANLVRRLNKGERAAVEACLEEVYI